MNELTFMHENNSGIYNYCDRCCEKCSYTNRCLPIKQESEREIKHILRDGDKNDLGVLAKDLAADFKEAFDHINKFMDEENEEFEKDDFNFDDKEDEDDFEKGFFKEEIDGDDKPSTFLKKADNPLISLPEKLFKALKNITIC